MSTEKRKFPREEGKNCDPQVASPAEAGEGEISVRGRGSSNLQLYFKTAIRVTAFLMIESLTYSIFTLSPIRGGLESKKVL
jgi:hypothetical protein